MDDIKERLRDAKHWPIAADALAAIELLERRIREQAVFESSHIALVRERDATIAELKTKSAQLQGTNSEQRIAQAAYDRGMEAKDLREERSRLLQYVADTEVRYGAKCDEVRELTAAIESREARAKELADKLSNAYSMSWHPLVYEAITFLRGE